MSFCLADVALCDMRRLSEDMCVCVHDRRGPKVAVCMGESAALCPVQGVTRSCDVILHGRRGTLPHSMFFRRHLCVCAHHRRGTKVAVSREETAKSRLFQGVMTARCDMVSRGRHGT